MSFSPMDFHALVKRIETLWGPNQDAWRDSNLWKEFQSFTVGCVWEALRMFETEASQFAPKPVKLKKACHEVQRLRIDAGIDPPERGDCEHPYWGVVHRAGEWCYLGEESNCDELDEHQACSRCGKERRKRRSIDEVAA